MGALTERSWRRVAVALVLVELVASGLDLWLGPFSRVHWEERFNARSGVMFACGHLEDAFTLQYRTFCGGCTAEGLMAAPLFQALGSTHRVWKLVPEAFHAVVMVAGAALSLRAGGGRAAAAFAALMFASPGVYRELAHTGWGNHVEGPAFPLVAVVLLLAAAGRGWTTQLVLGALAGLLTGLGLWFAHMSAHLLPAVALAALLVAPRALPAWVAATPIGLLPWWLYHQARPQAQDFAEGWMSAVELAPPARWVDWVFGTGMRSGLWDPVDYPDVAWVADLWWLGAWGLCVWAGGRMVAELWRERSARAVAAAVGPVGLGTLLLLYGLRFDLWSNLPDPYGAPSFNLRYRVPMWPMMALCLAAPMGAWAGARPGRWALGLLPLVLVGSTLRISQWTAPRASFSGLRVFAHDGWSDDTVPLGSPPQHRKEAQGRPVDLQAGLDWLAEHDDPLPECGWAHVFEVGRRLGVALASDPDRADLPAALAAAADQAATPAGHRMLAFGIAKGLAPTGDLTALDLAPIADRLRPAALATAVERELGALARERLRPDGDAGRSLRPTVRQGLCEARGANAVAEATRHGERPPAALHLEAGDCGAEVGPGIAAAWGQWVGCEPRHGAALAVTLAGQGASAQPEAWDRYGAACEQHRGRPAPSAPTP